MLLREESVVAARKTGIHRQSFFSMKFDFAMTGVSKNILAASIYSFETTLRRSF
jgi:hypothetical protein